MKIGIYGGTFDPVHLGHQQIAKAAIEELALDKLIVLPAGEPPHKKENVTDKKKRLEMCKLAFCGDKIEVSDYEIEKKTKSYTYETLEYFAKSGNELYFIMGGDSLRDIYKWKNPDRIFELSKVVVCGRNAKENLAANPSLKNKVLVLKCKPLEISSTEVKIMNEFGKDLGKAVPAEIAEYIEKEKLYRNYRKLTAKVQKMLTPSRYEHTMNVTVCGVNLAKEANVKEEDAFIACTLHDSAKCLDDFSKYRAKLEKEDMLIPEPVIHAFVGSYILKKEFGINNKDIRNAIKYHTTARPNMSNLEKLVYVSDCIEKNRKYEGVEEIRKVVERDFERGFVMCLNASFNIVVDKTICPLTLDAIDYYGK